MRILPFLSLLTFFLAACSAAVVDPPSAAPASAPTPSTAANDSEFIRTSCETTLYPELCYHSLAGYANAVQQDPGRLARVAIGVSLSRAARMTIYLANVSRQVDYSADHRQPWPSTTASLSSATRWTR
ncbi:UNVERIFIED_CONTAM: Pectinesterase inhibitor 10 [Sesamum angustifolium]|uniref:Pectinesterase inhibitor 10 n=1 Tax=Sesamum angustifolium TaxID=2727405 RepID=A0AAW2M7E8_9LAMI